MARPELLATLDALAGSDTATVRAVYAELGFVRPWPGRGAALRRIRDRILNRHDTYWRVQMGAAAK